MSEGATIKKKPNRIRRFLYLLLGLFIILFLVTYIALQIPVVQNWVVDKVANQYSEKLETTVKIDKIDIDFTNHLILDGLYIEDHNQDTLIYVGHFRTDLARSILTLFSSEIYVEEASLEKAVVHIRTLKGEKRSNLEQVFAKDPEASDDEKKPSAWKIQIAKFFAKDVLVDRLDENKGSLEQVTIPQGTVIINPNSVGGILEIKNIDFQSPVIRMESWSVDDPLVDTSEPIKEPEQISADSTKNWIVIRDIEIRDGTFTKSNRDVDKVTFNTTETAFDPNHIDLNNISMTIKNVNFEDGELSLVPIHVSAESQSGFVLKEFKADKFEFLKKKIKISDLYLKTGNSLIKRNVELSYKEFSDFNEFEDKVYLNVDLDNSRIALSEILHFVPSLESSQFISQNRNLVASIDGIVTGRINNLRIKDLTLALGNDIYLAGNFRARDITDPSQTLLNLELDQLDSDVSTIKKLIPAINLPKEFQKLGDFEFSGQFDGFYKDFVAYGKLRTDLGSADLDMRLDTEQGRAGAQYSGKILLNEFDLGAWTDNPELGRISGNAEIKNGYSLLAQTAKANLEAIISSFEFRNYNYRDVRFNGLLEAGQLNGTLSMDDENLAFDFSGSLVYGDQEPSYNFSSHIDRIDLQKLNLSKRPLVLSGKIDMDATDLNLNTIDGDVFMEDWTLQIDDTLKYYFDSLEIHSAYQGNDAKTLEVKSDILDLDISGKFILDKIHLSFLKMINNNYPEFYTRFNLPEKNFEGLENQFFDFKLDVKDSQNLFTILNNSPIDTIRDFKLVGAYRSAQNYFKLDGYTPKTTIDDVSIYGLALKSEQQSGVLTTSIMTDSLFVADKIRTQALKMDNRLSNDTLNFRLNSAKLADVLEDLNIGGDLFLEGDNFGLTFNSSDLYVLDEKWELSKNNKILFNKGFVRTSDLFASNGQQFLYVNSINDKGLEIGAEYFDVDLVNSLWAYDKLNFRGEFELFVRTDDVFNLTNFQSDLHLDSLFINGDHYGEFMLDTRMNGVKMPVRAALNIVDENKYLSAVGMVTPKGFGKPQSPVTVLDMEVYLEDYPAEIIEYWLGDGIENTKGIVDAELKLKGPISKIDMSGVGHIQDAETRVVFLGTTYKLADMDVPVSNTLIDLTGGVLIDRYGNRATAVGGIIHDKMTDLSLDIELKSDRFLALNTDKYSGESFYGHAVGKMQVNFDGSVDAPDISVVGVTGDSTEIFIPLEQANGLAESDFVVFDHDTLGLDLEDIEDRFKVSGINFSMDLEVNDKASMKIIMDELEENVMSGTGNGNLSIEMNRSGDFSVFGDYEIEQGNYIYSFENTIKRNFEIDKGGRVKWTGDPFNATMDVVAEYTTNTSITPFVEEFLGPPNSNDPRHIALRQEARKNQRVKVILSITGRLLQPQINFDLAFLDLPSGELGNAVNTKMNTIQADQNLLNRQAFSLLIFGGFLPEDAGSAVATSENLTNTVSEFVSHQLSKFISEVLHDAVTEASFISDFGLTIDYKKNVDYSTGSDDDVFLVNPEFELFDGKLNLSGGASYVNSSGVNGQYVANDVILQFSLNKSKRLRAKLYQISDLELGNRKLEIGAGISYQRDFDRFFFQRKEEEKKATKEK